MPMEIGMSELLNTRWKNQGRKQADACFWLGKWSHTPANGWFKEH